MPYVAATHVASCRLLLPRLLSQLAPCAANVHAKAHAPLAGALQQRARGSTAAGAASRADSTRCYSSSSSSDPQPAQLPASEKKRVVFCGTPEVAALVLKRLLAAAAAPDASFEVAAVVTQPARPTGRGNRKVPQPSPVEVAATVAGLPAERILAPERPGDKAFLAVLRDLSPDLCVTAAYGNYLPTAFLAIPPHGTLNIHPSLLPAYRGAAPVQRAVQDGLAVTGVTVLYTVKAMDAGPILAQQKFAVDPDVQAPQLLEQLFELGTDLLVENLEAVWAGMGQLAAQPQDEAAATHAPKLLREEAVLDFSQPAATCHNKVRAFAGWPSTFATFQLVPAAAAGSSSGNSSAGSHAGSGDAGDRSSSNGAASSGSSGNGAAGSELELKIVRTTLADPAVWRGGSEREVMATKEGLLICCGDGGVLQVLEVQAPGKRAMAARDFVNGLKGRMLLWQPVEQAADVAA